MKKLLLVVGLLFLTGCGNKDSILGTWSVSYVMPVFGNVTETYEFKEDGVCVRTLNTGNDIAEDCTYEFNEDKTKIRIVWNSKLDKEDFYDYSKNNDTEIKIGTRIFTKK